MMAMKQYSQINLNETTIKKEQDGNIYTDETTTLKNKINTVGTYSKKNIPKDDVTNNQKFIDTILHLNLKLCYSYYPCYIQNKEATT